MLICRFLVIVLLVALVGCSGADLPVDPPVPVNDEEPHAELTARVDEVIEAAMAESHLPGVAVVLVKDGKTIYQRGYGLADVEQGRAVDPETTIFRIGSISKALTLLTLTRLADDERVSLDDDVTDYFAEVSNPQGFAEPVTLADLLTHTTGFDQIGIGRQIGGFELPLEERKSYRPSLTEFLAADNLRRVSPAGLYYRYDTYGTTLAGAVIERVTGLPYDQAMEQEMFAPLGMARSSVEVEPESLGDLALGYGFIDGQYVAQPYEIYLTTPASSIDATAADMGRLLEALTGDGGNEHGRFFSSETAAAVLEPQFRPHAEFLGKTHGLRESRTGRGKLKNKVISIGHGGDMLGFKAALAILPEHRLGFFVATNRNGEAGGGRVEIGRLLIEALVEHLYGPIEEEPLLVPSIDPTRDLAEYTGDYHYGVYCHSCSDEELAQGGWPRGNSRPVTQEDGILQVGDEQYIPRDGDVFVERTGKRMVYFGRDGEGWVAYFVYSTSADTFERSS